jgi:hypothetical protein
MFNTICPSWTLDNRDRYNVSSAAARDPGVEGTTGFGLAARSGLSSSPDGLVARLGSGLSAWSGLGTRTGEYMTTLRLGVAGGDEDEDDVDPDDDDPDDPDEKDLRGRVPTWPDSAPSVCAASISASNCASGVGTYFGTGSDLAGSATFSAGRLLAAAFCPFVGSVRKCTGDA